VNQRTRPEMHCSGGDAARSSRRAPVCSRARHGTHTPPPRRKFQVLRCAHRNLTLSLSWQVAALDERLIKRESESAALRDALSQRDASISELRAKAVRSAQPRAACPSAQTDQLLTHAACLISSRTEIHCIQLPFPGNDTASWCAAPSFFAHSNSPQKCSVTAGVSQESEGMSGTEGDISALRAETIDLRAQLAGITAERDAARADAEAAAGEVRGDVLNSSCRDILRTARPVCTVGGTRRVRLVRGTEGGGGAPFDPSLCAGRETRCAA